MGREREQAQGKVLYAHCSRPQATQSGGRVLELVLGDCRRHPRRNPGGAMKIFRRKRFESDMDAELGFHIDAYINDLVRSGLDRTEAERRARIEFGTVEATKDDCRQAWGLQRMDELRADLRYTFRGLRQNPGFAAIAILSLALGIGANTAIFGLVDAIMLRILPVRDPARLVFVQNVGTQGPNGGPPYPCFEL